jgi:hypothetical protein
MTLNQVIQRIKKIAEDHKQINSFRFGDVVEWLSNGEIKYPACFCDLTNSTISRNENQTRHTIEVWFCDLGNVSGESRENEIEVISDLTGIAEDFAALLNYSGYDDWTVENNFQLQHFKEKFEDWTYAVRMTITVSSFFLDDRCQVPTVSDKI